MVGQLIADRYELKHVVGTGGMSSVYCAHDTLLERGLILLKAGISGNCIRVLCPLTIEDAVLDEALATWEDALASVLA